GWVLHVTGGRHCAVKDHANLVGRKFSSTPFLEKGRHLSRRERLFLDRERWRRFLDPLSHGLQNTAYGLSIECESLNDVLTLKADMLFGGTPDCGVLLTTRFHNVVIQRPFAFHGLNKIR